jgi:hypothetical protein
MHPAEEWLVFAGLCAIVFIVAVYRRYTRRGIRGDLFFWAVFCPTLIFFGTLMLVGKYSNGSDRLIKFVNNLFDWATRTTGLRLTQIAIALIVTVSGSIAHYFKTKNQTWYGNVEIVVGFLTALFVAGTLTPGHLDLSKWATLAGAAYVIARGCGNRQEGKRTANPPAVV